MSETPNRFVWHELITPDVKGAETFYTAVLGWTATAQPASNVDYTVFSVEGAGVCGMLTLSPEMAAMGVPPNWGGYIGVADVDAAAEKLKAAGGKVHKAPEDIPTVGRFAVVTDPQGASFTLFKGAPGTEAYAPEPVKQGYPQWNELHAADGESAYAFYADQFGWTKAEATDMGPMGVYQTFNIGSLWAGGIMTKMAHEPHPHWLFYFNVDDIHAGAARVTAAGGVVMNGPLEVPGGSWVVQCRDPQGALFALVGAHKE